MKLLKFSAVALLMLIGFSVFGQTYTTTGNSTNWNDPAAWVRTNPNNCGTIASTATVPPLTGQLNWPYCFPVRIIINHPIKFTGNANIGGGAMASLTVNSGGEVTFTGNLSVSNTGPSFIFDVKDGAIFKVGGEFKLMQGANFNMTNSTNASPKTYVELGKLKLENSGSWHSVNVGPNTILNINGQTDIVGGGTLNVFGEFDTRGDLFLRNNGGNQDRVTINGNAVFTVGGNTEINRPLRINDDAYVTFEGNVHMPNVGGPVLEVKNNADVLIKGNLTRAQWSNGVISVRNSSSLVICNDRSPIGEIDGAFPPTGGTVSVDSNAYYGGCARILPVELLHFDGIYHQEQKSSQIKWATAKEWENSHFEIERSIDAKTWEVIGQKDGMGWSDAPVDYIFVDSNLSSNQAIVYYRLKQVDFNGMFEYSKVVSVRIPVIEETKGAWGVYPNPSSAGEKIWLKNSNAQQENGQLLDVVLIQPTGIKTTNTSESLIELSSWINNQVSNAPKGVYILQISYSSKIEYVKILKK